MCGILFLVALIYQHSLDDTKSAGRSATNSLAVVIYMMCATVSAMLLFGVIKSRPSYLMPFFWIRLCDFFFSLPSFLSSLYANPAYATHWDQPPPTPPAGFIDMRRVWPPGTATTHSLLVSTCVVLFKGYFLCVVWKCYRYLKVREMILPLHLSFPAHVVGPDIAVPPGFLPPPPATVTVSPPDYETATKGSSAPPDYETAIRQPDLKPPASPTPTPAASLSESPSSSSSGAASQESPSPASPEQTGEHAAVVHLHDAQTEAGREEEQLGQAAKRQRRGSATPEDKGKADKKQDDDNDDVVDHA